jgi:hypothetical protein
MQDTQAAHEASSRQAVVSAQQLSFAHKMQAESAGSFVHVTMMLPPSPPAPPPPLVEAVPPAPPLPPPPLDVAPAVPVLPPPPVVEVLAPEPPPPDVDPSSEQAADAKIASAKTQEVLEVLTTSFVVNFAPGCESPR